MGTRNIRRQLQRQVYREMGISRSRPTTAATNRQILSVLHPTHAERSAMQSVAHDFSALPAESRAAFVERARIRQVLLQNQRIRQIVERYPRLGASLDSQIERALTQRGFKCTSELWGARKAIAAGIKTIDARTGGYSEIMNERMGKVAGSMLANVRAPTIFDIGTGAGSTILQVVENIHPAQRANAKIVISDVVPTALKSVRRQLAAMGVKPGNVIIFPVGFNHVCSTLRTMPRQPFLKKFPGYNFRKNLLSLIGQVDLFVSGATFNNFPKINGILRGTKALLKPGGAAVIWDWAGIETTARALPREQLERKMFATEGNAPTGRENLLSFSEYWLRSYIKDEARLQEALSRLQRDVGASNSFDFIKWAEANRGLFEQDWQKIAGQGRRNRGYRTTEQIAGDMQRAGMRVQSVFFPLYEPGKITQGNNQYIIIARK
ncbi:MAG: hypothetical protein NTW59_05410 [Candidatus Diapherotrites archaeon]|nr:hypothetical protein [Candidatus Diapherotrites archaeon]